MSEDVVTQGSCPSCGAPVHDEWRFCQECGAERPGLYERTAEPEDPVLTDAPPGGVHVRWRPVDALVVFGLSLLVTFVAASIAGTALGPPLTDAELDAVTIVSLLAHQLALIGGVVLWVRRSGPVREALGLRRFRGRDAGVGVLVGLGGAAISAMVAAIVGKAVEVIQGEPPTRPEQIPLEQDPTTLVLVILALITVLLTPFAEELFFRGMLHQSIRRRWRRMPSVLASSALFAVPHISPLIIPSIFALALLLSTGYERERSLWVPIVAHATFNVVGFTAAFLVGAGAS